MRPTLPTLLLAGLVLVLAGCKPKTPGQKLYGFNCGICHHSGGGQPGEFPPLVGRLDVIAQTPEGRKYLAAVMINGLNGPITAGGSSYDFSMPPFSRLSDKDLALILNWLISQGKTTPSPTISPDLFSEARAQKIGSVKVHKMRGELRAGGQID